MITFHFHLQSERVIIAVKCDHRSKFTAMITFHFHLQPQYNYELFHINFTSFHCTGRYELNKLTSLPMCGFIAQLVEHRTGIAEVTGSNPVEALIFSNCLNWKIYCDDHISLSSRRVVVSNPIWDSDFFPRLHFSLHLISLLLLLFHR